MKFKLLESSYDNWHNPESITLAQAESLLQGPYSQADKAVPIYRGIEAYYSYRPFIVFPSAKALRTSAYAQLNYYTMVMNNSKAWSKFPKRQIICTTDKSKASEYGSIFRVFPKNNAIIGVCPHADIWDSDFNELNGELEQFFNDTIHWHASEAADANWEKFVKICNKVDEMKKTPKKRERLENYDNYSDGNLDIGVYLDSNIKFLDFISKYIYRPHNFVATSIKNFKTPLPDREVWTDAPCLMYPIRKTNKPYDDIDDLDEEYEDEESL